MNEFIKWIGSYASVIVDDYLYFSGSRFNALFRYGLESRKLEFLGSFPNIPVDTFDMHFKAHVYGSSIIWEPGKDRYLRIFNVENKTISSVELPQSMRRDGQQFEGCVSGNKYYIASSNLGVYELDIKEKSWRCDDELSGLLLDYSNQHANNCMIFCNEQKIIIVDPNGREFRCLSIADGDFKDYRFSDDNRHIYKVFFNDGYFWMLFSNSYDVVKWDGKDNYSSFKIQNALKDDNRLPYSKIIISPYGKWITNYYSSFPLYINEENGFLESALSRGYSVDIHLNDYGPCFGNGIPYGNGIVFVPHRSKELIIYDAEKKKIESRLLSSGRCENYPQLVHLFGENKIVLFEDEELTVKKYIESV